MTWFCFLRLVLHIVWFSVNQYGGWFCTKQLHLSYHWNVRYYQVPADTEITAFPKQTFPGNEFIIFYSLQLQIVLLKLYLKMAFAHLSCWGGSNVTFIMFWESGLGQSALSFRGEKMFFNFPSGYETVLKQTWLPPLWFHYCSEMSPLLQ